MLGPPPKAPAPPAPIGTPSCVFEWLDDFTFKPFEARDQQILNAHLQMRPCPRNVNVSRGIIEHFDRVAYGEAEQVTRIRRYIRIRPPYRIHDGSTPPHRLPDLTPGSFFFEYEDRGQWHQYKQPLQAELGLFLKSWPWPKQVVFTEQPHRYRLLNFDALCHAQFKSSNLIQENIKTKTTRTVQFRAPGLGLYSLPSTTTSASSSSSRPVRQRDGSFGGIAGKFTGAFRRTGTGGSSTSGGGGGGDRHAPPREARQFRLKHDVQVSHRTSRGWQPLMLDQGPIFAAWVAEPRQKELQLGSAAKITDFHLFESGGAKLNGDPLAISFVQPLAPGSIQLPQDLEVEGEFDAARFGKYMTEAEARGKDCIICTEALSAQRDPRGLCSSSLRPSNAMEVDEGDGAPTKAFELWCGHSFCVPCLSTWFGEQHKVKCPVCSKAFGVVTGNQPREGIFFWTEESGALPGRNCSTYFRIEFRFPDGVDDEGKSYHSRIVWGYLPNDVEGRLLLELFKVAFKRRVMFGLGDSMTRPGHYFPTYNVHIKTKREGSAEEHGYPDPKLFENTLGELERNGVTIKDLR